MFMKPVQGVVVNQVCPMSMSSGAGSLKLQCCGPKCAAWVWDWYREEIGKDMDGFRKFVDYPGRIGHCGMVDSRSHGVITNQFKGVDILMKWEDEDYNSYSLEG